MSAHTVARDADSATIEFLERREQRIRKLLCDVRIHVVALRPWLLRRVDVETCSGAEVVGVILTLYL